MLQLSSMSKLNISIYLGLPSHAGRRQLSQIKKVIGEVLGGKGHQ